MRDNINSISSIDKNSSMINTKMSDESREFRELNKEIYTRVQQGGDNSIVSGISLNNNTNGSIGVIMMDAKWSKNITPDTSEIFREKVSSLNQTAANKTKKSMHTLIPNPNSKKNSINYTSTTVGNTDNDDIENIPNTEESINPLNFQACKTNDLSELSMNIHHINGQNNLSVIPNKSRQLIQNDYHPHHQWKTNDNDIILPKENDYSSKFDNIPMINQPYNNLNMNYYPNSYNNHETNVMYNYYMGNNPPQSMMMYQQHIQNDHYNPYMPQKIPMHYHDNNAFSYNNEPYDQKKKIKKNIDLTLFTINIEQILKGIDIRTTIMIRHIPNKYSAQTLLEEIDVACKSKYDFFYLPIDGNNQCNLGYSFINFINPLHIIYFFKLFKSRKWNYYKSHKECDLTFAKFQGKIELTAHLEKNTHKTDETKKPMLFTPPLQLPKIDIPKEWREVIEACRPDIKEQIVYK